jgi:hypothetical protein
MSPQVTAQPRSRQRATEVVNRRRVDRDASALAGMADDLDLDRLIFNWVNDRVPDVEVRGAITGITIERTIEGASTVEITIRDPDQRIFAGSRMWEPKVKRDKHGRVAREYDYYGQRVTKPQERGRAMEIDLDGIVFRLVKVSKTGDDLTLTFEDRVIYWLRRKKGEKRSPRKRLTRAQFILGLLREIKAERVRFVCPELNLRQQVDKDKSNPRVRVGKAASSSASRSRGTNKSGRGLAPSGALTVKGARATAEQRRIAERVLAVADDHNAGSKATLALAEACIVESGFRNLPYGHSSSVGVLQLLNIHGSTTTRLNIEWTVRKFLHDGFTGRGGAIALARKHPSWSAGQVAQACQGSAFPERYDQVQHEAAKWVSAYAGSGADIAEGSAAGGNTRYKSYQFAREGDEDSWTAIQRLAQEVGWRCFMMGHSLYYMSEEDLFRRKPQYAIKPADPAILAFDYDIDWGKTVSEARVSVVAGRWKAPPGEPVLVEGFGPPDGRWLVTSWRRDYFSPIVEITIRQPGREAMEPAAETVTKSGGADEGTGLVGGLKGDAGRKVMKAYRRADAIDRKNQGYKWGGGHGSFNDSGGYDCSGFVSSCLHAAGLLDTPQATPGLQSWGHAGHGKHMTVYVKENGNPHMSHTFIVFNIKGKRRFAEAGGANSGHTGWHRARSTAGFQPRYWPNT